MRHKGKNRRPIIRAVKRKGCSLRFVVFADGGLSEPQMLNAVRAYFPGVTRMRGRSCDVRDHRLEIRCHAAGGHDWRVEATPLQDDIDEGHQAAFARDLASCLWAIGMRPTVAADFEA
jgi:hypothetical protein